MMILQEWKALRRSVHAEFYADLEDTAKCGAFDGGCLVVAEALHRNIGGDIVVLVNSENHAAHAAVLFDGKLWDYNGPMSPGQFIARFNREEVWSIAWHTVGYRPIQDGDLECAYRNEDLVDRLASKFKQMFLQNEHGEAYLASPSFR